MKTQADTIVANATPQGRGGISIVRISGPLVSYVATHIIKKIPQARYATFSSFFEANGNVIDQGIALYFPAPHSFTGEDILELQGHGGPMVTNELIHRVLELGARGARPGEFSLRAFLNNKIDLTQAEAIADLIDASSTQAARNALHSLQGNFSKKIRALVESLIQLRTYAEAAIDFVQEEIDFLSNQQVSARLDQIIQELKLIQATATQGSLIRDGITAVIAGQPNVGKSSLLNQLSGKDSAIVTAMPGTTRDVLREHILIDDLPMHIIDTAGLHESGDCIEQEGIRRAHAEIKQADFVLFVTDASKNETAFLTDFLSIVPKKTVIITIRNKIDLIAESPKVIRGNKETIISLSAKSGAGIDLLKTQIKIYAGYHSTPEGVFSARRRHVDALSRAQKFLLSSQQQLDNRASELFAEDLRQAQNSLNEITGEFNADDLLGRIFSSFCIGK